MCLEQLQLMVPFILHCWSYLTFVMTMSFFLPLLILIHGYTLRGTKSLCMQIDCRMWNLIMLCVEIFYALLIHVILDICQLSWISCTLPGLTNLENLNLSFTLVTDSGLKKLSGLTSLKSLNLDSRQITDAGLAVLTSKYFQYFVYLS